MDVKKLSLGLVFLFVIIANTIIAFATEEYEILGREIEKEIIEITPGNIKEYYYELTDKEFNMKNATEFDPKVLTAKLFEYTKKQFGQPVKTVSQVIILGAIMGIVQVLMNSFAEKQLHTVFMITALLCVSNLVITPIVDCIKNSVLAIKDGTVFMSSLVPALSTLLTTMGKPTTATVYNMGILAISGVVSYISEKILVPFLGIYFAFALVGVITGKNELVGIANTLKNLTGWFLGFLMFIFTGFLGLQSFIGSATDSLAVKAAKFAISGFVPIIGSAVSEAFGITRGCLGLIKSSVGIMGVAGVLVCFLPSIIKCSLWYITCKICMFSSEFLDLSQVGKLFGICSETVKITISLLFSYLIMVVISTGIVIFISAGGV